MPKTKKLITVPEQNEHFKGTEFKRWDSFLASYLKDYPEMKLACVRMLQGSGESPKRMKI